MIVPVEKDLKTAINRFASTLSGGFKAFHLYRHDNKALDEIMQNLVARFAAAAAHQPLIKLGVTNQSLVYQGEPIGIKELTLHLAMGLRNLGFKEIIFMAPLQGRHFFQLLNILSSKDPQDVKIEKLLPLISDGEDKPIALVPVTSNSLLLKMTDELLEKRLAPLKIPQAQGGTGFQDLMAHTRFENLPDVYTWICVKAAGLDKNLAAFVRNLTDAAREGFFPWERYLKVFPFPLALKEQLFNQLTTIPRIRQRRPSELGISFHPTSSIKPPIRVNWPTQLAAFSGADIKTRQDLYQKGIQQSGLQELELADALLSETGANFHLGLRFLIRFLSQQNQMAAQEKALKLGIGVWIKNQSVQDDINLLTLLSTLRQYLVAPHNMNLTLFPLRNLTVESEMFARITQYLLSLGEAALPSLIQALDAEQDRSMRRKLCHVITLIAKERGGDFLLETLPKASTFLIRNIVMILGDIRNAASVPTLLSLTSHNQKIVRIEAVRSLGKISTPEAIQALLHILTGDVESDEQKLALNSLINLKETSVREVLGHLTVQSTTPLNVRKAIQSALSSGAS